MADRAAPDRTLSVWCPDWPVATARRDDPALVGVPVAVVDRIGGRSVVRAASAEARAAAVVPGLRRREAEGRCPGLVVCATDPAAEARAFESVARATAAVTPRVVLERPGVCAFPTRGPSRYFGGDDALAARVLEVVRAVGVTDARVGIADGAFAAACAARAAVPDGAFVVPPGGSAAFLAPWPVRVLGPAAADLVDLLVRLGLPTLGDFAALPADAVLARFGARGVEAHRRAGAREDLGVRPLPPPPDLVEQVELDPPARRVDEAAFAAKGLADRLLDRLAALALSCTQVVVEAETEHGESLARSWRHDGALTAAAVATRVRWQLDAWLTGATGVGDGRGVGSGVDDDGYEPTGGLTLVRLVPEQVVPAEGRQLGFWGGDAAVADRADRVLARLQGMLGHDAVVTACVVGGRTPAERVRWVPWGDARDDGGSGGGGGAGDPGDAPWPGTVPGPAPARVHDPGLPAELLDARGRPVTVGGRGEVGAPPARLVCAALPGGGGPVRAWAGPWLHDLRWWDRATRRRRALWHVVVAASGDADPADPGCDPVDGIGDQACNTVDGIGDQACNTVDGIGDQACNTVDGIACLVAIERGHASVTAVHD